MAEILVLAEHAGGEVSQTQTAPTAEPAVVEQAVAADSAPSAPAPKLALAADESRSDQTSS